MATSFTPERIAELEARQPLQAEDCIELADKWGLSPSVVRGFALHRGISLAPLGASVAKPSRKKKVENQRLVAPSERSELDYNEAANSMTLTSIDDYRICSSKTQAGLVQEVTRLIGLGYQPLGGVSAAAFGISPVGGNQYIQAMVKYS